MRRLIVVVFTLLATQGLADAHGARQVTIQNQRMQQVEVKETLMQGLMTLADLQIADHPGRHSPIYDSCTTGDGCLSIFPYYDPRLTLGIPTPPFWSKIKNYPNEWASSIHVLTQFIKTPDGQAPMLIPDANMFVTASILYPLVFVKDFASGPLNRIAKDAVETIRNYKRNGAYSFWREHPSQLSGLNVIGPLNIPTKILSTIADIMMKISPNPSDDNPHKSPDGQGPNMRPGWAKALMDKTINPIGVESFFNIPNDADDTAMAMIAFRMFEADHQSELDELAQILFNYRDVNRTYEDGRDRWKGKNSGAFLTWLKDESLPIAEALDPQDGSIPFGVNNVDCVVNANVVFALGLAGYGQARATYDALSALNKSVELESWPFCGLYYPHKMMLPYTLTRAYRDGGLSHPGKKRALSRILTHLIAEQKELAQKEPKHIGAFPGGIDKTYDLATALAVNALLNIGRDIPTELGLIEDYERAIDQGIQYLIKHKMRAKVRFPDKLGELYHASPVAAMWKPGIFFSASVQEAAQWRSEAYTAAIVVEAFAKYLLAWEYRTSSILENVSLQVYEGDIAL